MYVNLCACIVKLGEGSITLSSLPLSLQAKGMWAAWPFPKPLLSQTNRLIWHRRRRPLYLLVSSRTSVLVGTILLFLQCYFSSSQINHCELSSKGSDPADLTSVNYLKLVLLLCNSVFVICHSTFNHRIRLQQGIFAY